MANNKQRRKNYFIKKKFQAKFFVKFAVLLILEAALIAGLFMFISKDTLTTAYYGTELRLERTGAFFFVSFLTITLIVGTAIGITGIFIFMYLSHRIAGPLHRFEKTVEEARRGNLAHRAHLRKSDELRELEEPMNGFLADMDSRISGIKNEVTEGLRVVRRDPNSSAKILEKIKQSLSHFKTSR